MTMIEFTSIARGQQVQGVLTRTAEWKDVPHRGDIVQVAGEYELVVETVVWRGNGSPWVVLEPTSRTEMEDILARCLVLRTGEVWTIEE